MNEPAKSYEKVHYEFRPAKQVERRMLLDTFQKLMSVGFQISYYQYTGLGSIYFVDFIMFHRYLGIQNLISIECSTEIEKRVKFNRPFKQVRVEIGDVIDYIPKLSPDLRHILWLDYDHILTEDVVNAVTMSSSQLSAGSVFLVTVDVEPPGLSSDGPKEWREHFVREAGKYIGPKPTPADFAQSKLPAVNAMILDKAIRNGLSGRANVRFCPLFNFLYADGHQMLSVGGMIGREDDEGRLKSLDRRQLPFLRDKLTVDPYEIRVPLVTRKERHHLDSAMPCRKGWKPRDFELKREEIEEYRKIYRYYPVFTEMFL
jgi:hypothetical protein